MSPPAELPVRLRVFGGLRLWRSGAEVAIGSPRQRTVLAVLVAARGNVVTISELIDLVWGTQPSATAVNQLHRLIGQVRRLFEPELASRTTGRWVQPAGDGYRLPLDARACDLVEFGELSRAGRAAATDGRIKDATRAYGMALDLAQDPPFADLGPELVGHPSFAALDRERIEVAVEAAGLGLRAPAEIRYVPALERIAASAPLHEPVQALMVRLLTATGRRAEALALFDGTRRRLAEELGVDPGPELRAAQRTALADELPAEQLRPVQLPPTVAGFIARPDLTARLDDQLAGTSEGETSQIVLLSGMGGVGKTTAAVDWAHRVVSRFHDGALYLNLRGFDPDDRQVQPADALHTLLDSLGVPGPAMGDDVDARAARFRSAMAGRRMIILLDNARDSEQVRPLLPGTAGSLVVVTSRNRLTGLVAREGAHPFPIDRLTDDRARELLARRLGARRLADEPQAVDQLVRLCAGLPLALSIAAARVAVNPAMMLARVVAELGSTQRRLDALATGETSDDVRSTFSWSYRGLTPAAARMFRLLAVHPGSEMSLSSAASLAGTDLVATSAAVAELVTATMLVEAADRRYTMHDLLRAYAGELLDPDARRTAEDRLIEHYVHSARNAHLAFRRPIMSELDPPPPGLAPDEMPDFTAATEWYSLERTALDGIVDLALARGRARAAALITIDLRPVRVICAEPPHGALSRILRVFEASAGLDEPALRAEMLRLTGYGLRRGDLDRFVAYVTEALAIYERSGDLIGQSNAWRDLTLNRRRPLVDRLGYARRSVELARRSGHPGLLVVALDAVSFALEEAEDWPQLIEASEESLAIAVEHNMVDLQLEPAGRLSEVWLLLGDHARALDMAEWALARSPASDIFTTLPVSAALAEAALGTGDQDRARKAIAQFRQAADQHGEAYRQLWGGALVDDYIAKVDRVEAALGGPS